MHLNINFILFVAWTKHKFTQKLYIEVLWILNSIKCIRKTDETIRKVVVHRYSDKLSKSRQPC